MWVGLQGTEVSTQVPLRFQAIQPIFTWYLSTTRQNTELCDALSTVNSDYLISIFNGCGVTDSIFCAILAPQEFTILL